MQSLDMFALLLLTALQVQVVEGGDSPKYFWPFCNVTMAYDLEGNVDAIQPTVDVCHKLVPGPAFLGGLNVFYFSSPEDTVIMNVAGGGAKKIWKVTMNIYPQSLNGVIVEHHTTTTSTTKLGGFTIYLDKGRPVLIGYDYFNTTVLTFESNELVELNTWTTLWCGITDGVVSIRVNDKVTQDARVIMNEQEIDFELDGMVYIAQSTRSPDRTAYKGRLCCLMMFESPSSSLSVATVTDICTEPRWARYPPNPVATNCPVSSGDDDILLLVPFTELSKGYDVRSSSPPLAPAEFACFRMADSMPEMNASSVVYLDGSIFSYITLSLADETVNKEVTIAIYVRPDSPSEGVIWEYTAHADKPDGVTRMTLSLTPTDASLDIYTKTGLCGNVVNSIAVPSDQWVLIYVTLTPRRQIAWLYVGPTGVSTTTSCVSETATTVSSLGTLTVGSGYDSGGDHFGYHGAVACLTVVGWEAGSSYIAEKVMSVCNRLDYDTGVSCTPTSIPASRRYKSVLKDNAPTSVANDMHSARSVLECSKKCLTQELCKSFVYKKGATADQCAMYFYVTRHGLTSHSGKDYYKVTSSV